VDLWIQRVTLAALVALAATLVTVGVVLYAPTSEATPAPERTHVAELALEAAGRLVRSEMDGPTQRRLVEDFLSEVTPADAKGSRN
jgi:hypothetical protein